MPYTHCRRQVSSRRRCELSWLRTTVSNSVAIRSAVTTLEKWKCLCDRRRRQVWTFSFFGVLLLRFSRFLRTVADLIHSALPYLYCYWDIASELTEVHYALFVSPVLATPQLTCCMLWLGVVHELQLGQRLGWIHQTGLYRSLISSLYLR